MNTQRTASRANPLPALHAHGQSIWLDFIRRNLLASDAFAAQIDADALMGVTSNPSIFEKAIAGGDEYKGELATVRALCASNPKAAYERLAISDIRRACDLFAPVYAATACRDGYVSLEVSPKLAHDTAGTLEEARRLWREVGRANLMVKVPATAAGVPAIRTLIGEGINVNVTLLFSVDAYRRVSEAYLAGLEALVANGGDPAKVASVASFFVSRVDSAVDALLDEKAASAGDADRKLCASLRGTIAIANAKQAYKYFLDMVATPRWKALAARGAQPQRLLWASTGTKDARYSDVLYVEELIGADTVNTVPPQTLDAFRDHGTPRASLAEDMDKWIAHLAQLDALGIRLEPVCEKLLAEGVTMFDTAFDKLIAAVASQGKV
jgi:transaldolase/glucose-6-phosphate isomerase